MNRLSAFQSVLVRSTARLLSRRGSGNSLLVLIYHRVLPAPDPMHKDEPDAATFAAQMDLVAANFNVLPLSEACGRLRSGCLPARAISVTFDDGYANNLEIAAPILAARRIPATVFIASGFVGGGRMFNDTVIEAIRRAPAELDLCDLGFGRLALGDAEARRSSAASILQALRYVEQSERLRRAELIAQRVGGKLPDDLMMTEAQIRALPRHGIEIGAHTVHHPILTRVDGQTARREIADSKHRLEEITGARVAVFAFPNGRPRTDYDDSHVAMVRDLGFRAAVSTAWGAATAGSDPFQIPRIAPWDRTALRFAARIAMAYRQRGELCGCPHA